MQNLLIPINYGPDCTEHSIDLVGLKFESHHIDKIKAALLFLSENPHFEKITMPFSSTDIFEKDDDDDDLFVSEANIIGECLNTYKNNTIYWAAQSKHCASDEWESNPFTINEQGTQFVIEE